MSFVRFETSGIRRIREIFMEDLIKNWNKLCECVYQRLLLRILGS